MVTKTTLRFPTPREERFLLKFSLKFNDIYIEMIRFVNGTRIGPRNNTRYEIVKSHGGKIDEKTHQATSYVIEAIDHDADGRRVMLKLLDLNVIGERRSYEGEHAFLSATQSPTFPSLHDVGEIDGLHYLAIEIVGGRQFGEMVAVGTLGATIAIRNIIQICKGLSEMHADDVFHGDVRPMHFFVQEDGSVRVIDFGQSRKFPYNNQFGNIGNVEYMAPERFYHAQNFYWSQHIDHKIDIYAVALMLYRLIGGSNPMWKSNRFETIKNHVCLDLPEISVRDKVWKKEDEMLRDPEKVAILNGIVQRGADKMPELRSDNISTMASELSVLL